MKKALIVLMILLATAVAVAFFLGGGRKFSEFGEIKEVREFDDCG